MTHIRLESALRTLDSLKAIPELNQPKFKIADTLQNPNNGRIIIFNATSDRAKLIEKDDANKDLVISFSSFLCAIAGLCAGGFINVISGDKFKRKPNTGFLQKRELLIWCLTGSGIALTLNYFYRMATRKSDIRN